MPDIMSQWGGEGRGRRGGVKRNEGLGVTPCDLALRA